MTKETAIKKIREAMPTLWKETKDAIQTLIPELRESEDERIRKEIRDFLIDMECKKEWITYIEKQKESLHIQETCKENPDSFTDEDEKIRKIITDSVFLAYGANDEYRDVLDYLDRCGLEKQKEPENTSASTMIPSCWAEEPSLQKEQNPLTDFEAAIYSYLSDDTSGKFDKEVMHKCAIERAKILLELARKEQKPAEWSEEDEKIVNNIVSVLGQYIDYKAVSGTGSGYATPRYAKEIAWLKSLRPHWKPSKDEESKK